MTAPSRHTLVTGGAGFIGTNLADRLLAAGEPVLVFDNLSRAGVEANVAWLRKRHGSALQVQVADVRDAAAVTRAMRGARQVFHFAAQVAVTTSLVRPDLDFSVNAVGTMNVLEAIRRRDDPPPLLFTSTNKVYGNLDDVPLAVEGDRYVAVDDSIRARGIDESRRLDFHSPYGCSKGTADQYVVDYARSFGLPAAVFRMSCIYGLHQCGTEDQGWIAHFMASFLDGRAIALYGDGRQVRDALFADDLIDAMLRAQRHMPAIAGQAFNMGGGPSRAVSLLEVLERIRRETGCDVPVTFEAWRTGDQRYYVSDTTRFQDATGWRPRIEVDEGIHRLAAWMRARRQHTERRAVRLAG